MPTVYIAINFNSVLGSVRRNPFLDDPIQLLTEDGDFINTQNAFELAITDPDYSIKDRANVQILDRAGSAINMRAS